MCYTYNMNKITNKTNTEGGMETKLFKVGTMVRDNRTNKLHVLAIDVTAKKEFDAWRIPNLMWLDSFDSHWIYDTDNKEIE
jgi:hypothetical protein